MKRILIDIFYVQKTGFTQHLQVFPGKVASRSYAVRRSILSY